MNDDRRRVLVSGALALAALGVHRLGRASAAADTAPAAIRLDAEARPPGPASGDQPPLRFAGDGTQVLRIRTGVPAAVRLTNHLDAPTTLEWHGMRLPNALDRPVGLGGQTVAAGATRDMVLTPHDSGTYWFHPSTLPGADDQTARGLAGVLIVEEPDGPEVDAEHVLLLTDKGAAGMDLADQLFINGKAWPETHSHAPGSRLRLRLVNGSTRQAVAATFAGARPFVVAIDGQPSELFQPLNDTIPVGPGARFDVLVDLPRDPGAALTLVLHGSEAPKTSGGGPAYVARSEGAARPERPPIRALTPNPALPRSIPLEHSVRADLTAVLAPGSPERWSVNGIDGTSLAKTPLFSAKKGSPVTLGLTNRSGRLTAVRLHGHAMRLLHSKDDGWEPYWRDSVIVPPGGTSHVAFVADNPGRWLIESPFFDQAARGLRCWFEVT